MSIVEQFNISSIPVNVIHFKLSFTFGGRNIGRDKVELLEEPHPPTKFYSLFDSATN